MPMTLQGLYIVSLMKNADFVAHWIPIDESTDITDIMQLTIFI